MTYRPTAPWQAEEPNRPKRKLIERVFDGEVSHADWRFMAIAILQLCDDLKALEKEVADLRAQAKCLPDMEDSAKIEAGRNAVDAASGPNRNRDLDGGAQHG